MQFDQLNRRAFISLLGGAAAWPLTARAQQPTMPVIGFLDPTSPDAFADPGRLRAFRQGLKDATYVEGENVAFVHRFAEYQTDRLPELATELVRRQVTVIVPLASDALAAARAATATIPIVFIVAEDPVLWPGLSRAGGNVTGINFYSAELATKRLELLRELVPTATRLAVLVNPTGPNAETTRTDVAAAAPALGFQIHVLSAGTSREIDSAFATFERERPDALFVGSGPFFNARRVQLTQWAARLAVPATYASRLAAEAGGLMSYGTSRTDSFRQMGVYAGRILKGAKPAELPVVQSTKFELVINHQTARMLGLAVPPSLLAIADEVIE